MVEKKDADSRAMEHALAASGQVVLTPEGELPFKAVLTDHKGDTSDHSFATMRECEAYIRERTPKPIAPSELHARKAGEA